MPENNFFDKINKTQKEFTDLLRKELAHKLKDFPGFENKSSIEVPPKEPVELVHKEEKVFESKNEITSKEVEYGHLLNHHMENSVPIADYFSVEIDFSREDYPMKPVVVEYSFN